MINHPYQKNHEGRKYLFGSQTQITVHHFGKIKTAGTWQTSHITSIDKNREQGLINVCMLVLRLLSPFHSVQGQYCETTLLMFTLAPSHFIKPWKSLIDISPGQLEKDKLSLRFSSWMILCCVWLTINKHYYFKKPLHFLETCL